MLTSRRFFFSFFFLQVGTYLRYSCVKTPRDTGALAGLVLECDFDAADRQRRRVRGSPVVEVVLCVQFLHRLDEELRSVAFDLEYRE